MTETLALKTEGEKNRADDGRTSVNEDSVASRHHLNCAVDTSKAEESEGVQAGARQRGGGRGINS